MQVFTDGTGRLRIQAMGLSLSVDLSKAEDRPRSLPMPIERDQDERGADRKHGDKDQPSQEGAVNLRKEVHRRIHGSVTCLPNQDIVDRRGPFDDRNDQGSGQEDVNLSTPPRPYKSTEIA